MATIDSPLRTTTSLLVEEAYYNKRYGILHSSQKYKDIPSESRCVHNLCFSKVCEDYSLIWKGKWSTFRKFEKIQITNWLCKTLSNWLFHYHLRVMPQLFGIGNYPGQEYKFYESILFVQMYCGIPRHKEIPWSSNQQDVSVG